MKYWSLLLIFLSHPSLGAEQVTFSSNGKQPQIIQLFTSQGCSSCPPAESYLGTFLGKDKLWSEIIPMAFHVDYWDYLGWKDKFSSHDNTQFQYQYKQLNNIGSVYTPGFVIDGKEWRNYFGLRTLPSPQENTNNLNATLSNNKLSVEYENAKETLVLHTVVIGSGISTNVEAGENEGRKLEQPFVVLSRTINRSKTGSWELEVPTINKSNANRLAIAMWLTTPYDLNPIQATAGWIN